ncbi:SDR family oxidoreductase [Luteibacter sp. 9133]|uniref:NAD-dependent epimerase/dehydratase family protein n=1 Tax=Luteibacter sp. 9133 TaxID=1500891 RepID=UPI0005BDBF88|nr:SDR family oxidoreductase [Luteibacter sp. 9133]
MFTVFGATGFIGRELVASLRESGAQVRTPERGDNLPDGSLGHVIYAVGVTADFRQRPFDTIEAHVSLASRLLRSTDFDSFLYLSSARLYRHAADTRESARITIDPAEAEDFYDLTKLTGESICHRSGRDNVRVVRLSNVIGRDFSSRNFVFDVMREAWEERRVMLRSAPDSAKDYILVEDVVRMLPLIAAGGTYSCYNLASGVNLSHAAVLAPILHASGAELVLDHKARAQAALPLDIGRLQAEFGFVPGTVLSQLESLTYEFGKSLNA